MDYFNFMGVKTMAGGEHGQPALFDFASGTTLAIIYFAAVDFFICTRFLIFFLLLKKMKSFKKSTSRS